DASANTEGVDVHLEPGHLLGFGSTSSEIYYKAEGGSFSRVDFVGSPGNDSIRYEGKLPGVLALHGSGGDDSFDVRLSPAIRSDGLLIDGGTGLNTITLTNASGRASIHNTPTGPDRGFLTVRYAPAPGSIISYEHIALVAGAPDAVVNYIRALHRHILGR